MKWLVILSTLALLNCQRGPSYHSLKFQQLEMSTPATDVRLPTKLWNLFENPTFEAVAETGTAKTTEFMPLKVYLYERNRGILGSENHLLVYPQGGGELDLKDFVTDKSGSFYFAAEPTVKAETGLLRVYFLSNSVERTVGHETFGSGCNTYFEVTSAFKKAIEKDGFLLNTTAQRHISALAGTFFFVMEDQSKLHIARLTVKDSRYPAVQCKR